MAPTKHLHKQDKAKKLLETQPPVPGTNNQTGQNVHHTNTTKQTNMVKAAANKLQTKKNVFLSPQGAKTIDFFKL